jgi:glycosyltransferase involved in cell wall biosynthesis
LSTFRYIEHREDGEMAMRVLHVQRAKGVSGSERHLLSLLPALGAVGVETRMCVLSTGDGQRFVSQLEAAGVDVTVRNAGGDLNVKLVPELVADIREFRADIVHTHLLHADLVGQVAAQLARVRGISSVHATPDFYRREPYRSTCRAISRLARRRVAISEHVARFLRELRLAPPERIRVVHYGIDAARWERDAPPRSVAREAFSVADPALVIGIAARLIDGKGHETLIEAVGKAIREDGIPAVLLVAGAGEERESLEQFAAAHCPPGRVRFLGFVPDVETFLTACDIVAFPTDGHGEGFGLTALEAMAAARPVVATRFASIPEVVEDSVTGVLVVPRSMESLRAALVGLARNSDGRVAMGEAGARRARELFALERMAAATREVYDEVA